MTEQWPHFALCEMGRKVRTAEHMVLRESEGSCLAKALQETVRATVTSRVAPGETTKRLGFFLYFVEEKGNPPSCNCRSSPQWICSLCSKACFRKGDKAAGTREIIVKQNLAYESHTFYTV